ncbi:MBL fold metallo-hydrolase [Ornithinibacillus gellani]|uniref:MBL fold metallo-hydrolase n=1 Tax=Ornithinibacillus gellani TaxID=2293253 RepID=UPI000F481FE1|nr:MBL fold metallo-hydrolase [Ornithinibacillus gellani]TQS74482.1 MBL fold metallo-hydrolase [Ornithinibacillus gellani]
MTALQETIYPITIPTPFAVGSVQAYLLKGDYLSLVDAGVQTAEAWQAVNEQLKRIGYKESDIEQIILTHHHPDHTGLVERFSGVKHIVAHKHVDKWLQKEEAFIQNYERFFLDFYKQNGVPEVFLQQLTSLRSLLQYGGEGRVTNYISEGDSLPGHTDWQVIETKGHAQTHVSFFDPSMQILIAGDHLLEHVSSNPLLEPAYEGQKQRAKPLLQYRKNMEKLLPYTINWVLPGHGQPFQGIHKLINTRLHQQEERAQKVLGMLQEAPKTAFQICELLFPVHVQTQLHLTMSETIGQLDFLEEIGKVAWQKDNGVYHYYAT